MTTTAALTTTPVVTATPTKTAKPKGILHYIGVGLSMGLLAFVALIALLVIALPMATKSTPYTILTSSMSPDLPAGSLVVVKPTSISDVKIGDIVTYQLKSGQPEVVTHRVVSIVEPSKPGASVQLITKGDANSLPDPAVKAIQVRGVVWYSVPYIGWVNNVVNGGQRAVIVPIIATLLFVYAGYLFVAWAIERRRRSSRAAAPALVETADLAPVSTDAADAADEAELVTAPR